MTKMIIEKKTASFVEIVVFALLFMTVEGI